jgi:CDP-diglyceride synthetase
LNDLLDQPEWLKRISPAKSCVGLLGGVIGSAVTYCMLPQFWNMIHRHHLAPNSTIDDLSIPLLFSTTTSSSSIISNTRFAFDNNGSASNNISNNCNPMAIGLTLGLAAILGDLWESAVKRTYGTKDMSRLLPGHGGVLDRFDSSLLAVLLYHYYVEQGIV